MSILLGGPPSFGPGQERINSTIANMTPMQLFEIMNQVKMLIQQNHQDARQILIKNPQLTKALFQAQIVLGMVKAPPAQPAAAPGRLAVLQGSPHRLTHEPLTNMCCRAVPSAAPPPAAMGMPPQMYPGEVVCP